MKKIGLSFYLTWKYITRGRKWTLLLTIFLMTAAFINLVFIPALFNGIINGSNQQIVDTLTGDIYVTPPNGSDYINDVSQVTNKIKSINGIKDVSAAFSVPARIKYNNITGNWQIIAVNPDNHSNVFDVSKKMTSGSYLASNDLNQIIIGRQIAGGKDVEENALSLKTARTGNNISLNLDNGISRTLKVKGIFNTGFVQSDERAFITYNELTSIMPTLKNKATTINIKLVTGANEGQVIKNIIADKLNVNVYSWQDAAGIMKSVSSSFVSINVLLSATSVLIAAVTIIIIIYITVINKRKEIGILRVIGVKPYIIVLSYVILSAIYALIGITVGTLVFWFVLTPYFEAHPFVLPICNAVLDLSWSDFIIRAQAILIVSIFSGLVPTLVVAHTKMLDAILGK
jgi:putative ABC transport system permease protein